MAYESSHLAIVDVESTCWERNNSPPNEHSEIIEIGICLLCIRTLLVIKTQRFLIKPLQSTVSDFCAQLTGLNQQELTQKGVSFEEACEILKRRSGFNTKRYGWASYGDYDRLTFQRQCLSHKITYPFSASHTNLKHWFAIRYSLSSEVGMIQALKMLGLALEGRHHSAMDDAKNVAKIAQYLLCRKTIEITTKYKIPKYRKSALDKE